MYNKFATTIYKGKWPCTTNLLYNEKNLIGRLHRYFLAYFVTFSAPQQKLSSYWYCPYWLWNPPIRSDSCTGIFFPALQKNHWMLFIMPVPMPEWIIPDLWMWPPPWLSDWFLSTCSLSRFSSALMIPWSQSSVKNLRMFQSFLTMQHTMVPITWTDTVL